MNMDEQIIAALQAKGLLTETTTQIVRDLVAQGKTLDQAVVSGKYATDQDMAKIRAEVLGLPYIDLTERVIPKETLDILPLETMETYQAVPTSFDGTTLEVALLDPKDYHATEALEFLAQERGWKISYVVAPQVQIQSLLKKVRGLGTEVATALAQAKGKFERVGEKSEDIGQLENVIKGAPVSRMVAIIMRHAVEGGASDIHIEPIAGESRVRYRIDGVLRTSLTLPLSVHPAIISRIKVLANMKIDEVRVPQDGRITQEISGKKIDFRVSTLPVLDQEKVVMRVLDTSVGAPTLEQLGYRPEHVKMVAEHIKRPYGMFLVTGPTGSGKSTTLFAILSMLNADGVNISTLEDPVEYYIPGVNQSQIHPEINYTFATGLRALLRQDPNVIMVGEIRDRETAELGIHASLTGHLMFSTVHTNDVFGLVPRLVDIGVEPFLIAATLNLAIAQRLARKICDGCKEPQEIAPEVVEKLRESLRHIPKKYLAPSMDLEGPLVFFHGKGCAKCGGSGYRGRIAIAEMFEFTEHVRTAIEKGFSTEKAHEEFTRQEGLMMRDDALLKALAGQTTVEEVFRLSQSAEEG